jgi:hypothetical protein
MYPQRTTFTERLRRYSNDSYQMVTTGYSQEPQHVEKPSASSKQLSTEVDILMIIVACEGRFCDCPNVLIIERRPYAGSKERYFKADPGSVPPLVCHLLKQLWGYVIKPRGKIVMAKSLYQVKRYSTEPLLVSVWVQRSARGPSKGLAYPLARCRARK